MDYKKFAFRPKDAIEGSSIGEGEVGFSHLDPALFAEIRQIQLHSHTGTGSTRLKLQNMDGYFPRTGFILYADDGSKKYQITITNAGLLQATEV